MEAYDAFSVCLSLTFSLHPHTTIPPTRPPSSSSQRYPTNKIEAHAASLKIVEVNPLH